MAAPAVGYRPLWIVIAEQDEFEEPTPLNPANTFLAHRNFQRLPLPQARINEVETINRILEARRRVFERRVQLEGQAIRRSINENKAPTS